MGDTSVLDSFSSACPSCCRACLTKLPPTSPESCRGPYALSNLLAAGTVEVGLSHSTFGCEHLHADDGWHNFCGQPYLQHLAAIEDDSLLRELDFLVKELFVKATCRLSSLRTVLFIRIYIIPYDLPNVQGRLRLRDEGRVLSHARRYMSKLLPKITQDEGSWGGDSFATSSNYPRWLFPEETDSRTLSEIYSDLPSPRVSAESMAAFEQIEGMRSTLYTYQRRSVAAMAQREMYPTTMPDPLFIPLVGMNDRDVCYLQPARMEILRERPMVTQIRGGVLCEELGTGKTVMILALILATIDQLPSPEESILDTRPILTPLAFRHFPSAECKSSRKRVGMSFSADDSEGSIVPSLLELLIHRTRASPDGAGLRYREYELEEGYPHLWRSLRETTPFYFQYDNEPEIVDSATFTSPRRKRRKKMSTSTRVIYLTTATLIVVPANLIAQWDREIQKHTLAAAVNLKVLVVRTKTEMPTLHRLAGDYDIVLMTQARFSVEASKGTDVSTLLKQPPCTCREAQLSTSHTRQPRVPTCTCPDPLGVSPLLQIRWKRLVIDEGHVSGTSANNLTTLAKLLNVERRWIVSGTPTTNLLGLSFGSHGDQHTIDYDYAVDDDYEELQYPPRDSPSIVSDASDQEQERARSRIWTVNDRQDLRKLAIMMSQFLLVPHFIVQPRVFDTHVIPPLMDAAGPRPGAVPVLSQVMNMAMIRHRIEDVEEDVVLPPLKQEVILLDLDPSAVKSYNALQAVIAINAVDSERVDQDYFFHPKNADSLKQVVENMSQFLFWGVSDNLFNIDESVKNADDHMRVAKERNTSDADLALLQEALLCLKSLANDELWRAMHAHEDVPFEVYNMAQPVYEAWTRFLPKSNLLGVDVVMERHNGFMHADRLVKIRDIVTSRPLIAEEQMIGLGRAVAEQDHEHRRLFLLQTEKSRKHPPKSRPSGGSTRGTSKAIMSAKGAAAPEKLDEVRKELQAAQVRLAALQEEVDNGTPGAEVPAPPSSGINAPEMDRTQAGLLSLSPMTRVRVGSSTSSKLNYILKEVLDYAPTEKFLIFSNSPLSLAHVAEGLALIGVKYLQFTTQVEPQVREQLVMTFETSDTFRVFLMELKHGARGLNLVSASRVIFCEPVWHADVESQAIKRAHRIGQTRPISVKTLCIRSTSEENMVARREALKERTSKLPDMTQEIGMRDFIANPKFLGEISSQISSLNLPLINVRRNSIDSDPSAAVSVTHEEPSLPRIRIRLPPPVSGIDSGEPTRKKRKGVRFADE